MQLAKGISFTFYDAGHVLGAAMIELKSSKTASSDIALFR